MLAFDLNLFRFATWGSKVLPVLKVQVVPSVLASEQLVAIKRMLRAHFEWSNRNHLAVVFDGPDYNWQSIYLCQVPLWRCHLILTLRVFLGLLLVFVLVLDWLVLLVLLLTFHVQNNLGCVPGEHSVETPNRSSMLLVQIIDQLRESELWVRSVWLH